MTTIASEGISTLPPASPLDAIGELGAVREATLELVSHIDEENLQRVHSPIMSPLVWDLGHIAAYEDLWLAHRLGGMELLRPDLAALYDAFETPRAVRGEIQALDPRQAHDYMSAVRDRSVEAITRQGLGNGLIFEMVLRHELQHSETMRQTMAIAGLLGPDEPALLPLQPDQEWLSFPAGAFQMGAPDGPDGAFAYDNERPRHTVELAAFQIARNPVSNASWMRFVESGGYERREWWSQEGWAWKEEHGGTHHPAVQAGHPDAAVCHVCWYEADAFARAQRARLPTEAEWEKAAGCSQMETETSGTLVHPTALQGVGQVWEWTSSHFLPYPGFSAYPYREYSEVFFGNTYRVLRGGSWATHPRVATTTFRNWDLPIRRQIFAGLRLAREDA